MNEMVDRVAGAILAGMASSVGLSEQDTYRFVARAAIEALSNLPREMAEVFAESYANGDPNDQIAPSGVIDAWRDTVASILK